MVSKSQFELRLIGFLCGGLTCLLHALYCVPNRYYCKVAGARIHGLWLCDYIFL